MLLSILVTIAYIVLFLVVSFWINKKYVKELSSATLPVLFIVKLLYAGLFYYIYAYYYGDGELIEDAAEYLNDSRIFYNIFHESPTDFFKLFFDFRTTPELIDNYLQETVKWSGGQFFFLNDTRNIVRINIIFQFISFGINYVHFVLFSFISLLAGIELFQWLKKKTTLPLLLAIVLITSIPSIALWGSSVLKEPLLLLGLTLFFRGLFDENVKYKWLRIISGSVLVIAFKPFIFALLIISVILYIFLKSFKSIATALLTFLGLGIVVFWIFSQPITSVISNKQADFYNVLEGGLYIVGDEEHFYYIPIEDRECFTIHTESEIAILNKPVTVYALKKNERIDRSPFELDEVGNSFEIYLNMDGANSEVPFTLINNSPKQLIYNIPISLKNSFLEPIPNSKTSIVQLASFLENIFYLILCLLVVLFPNRRERKQTNIIISLVGFIVLNALIVGLVTTIAGAIVRYMLPSHIAIIIVFIYSFDFDTIRLKRR